MNFAYKFIMYTSVTSMETSILNLNNIYPNQSKRGITIFPTCVQLVLHIYKTNILTK